MCTFMSLKTKRPPKSQEVWHVPAAIILTLWMAAVTYLSLISCPSRASRLTPSPWHTAEQNSSGSSPSSLAVKEELVSRRHFLDKETTAGEDGSGAPLESRRR